MVTALNPVIGYQKAAAIAKRAYKESRPIIDIAHEETGIPVSPQETIRSFKTNKGWYQVIMSSDLTSQM